MNIDSPMPDVRKALFTSPGVNAAEDYSKNIGIN